MKEVKSSTIEKEKTVNRCSYLDEFNRNIPRMEFINKQLCLNFPNRYEKDGKHYCIFHYPDKDKINDFELALEQKKIQGHYFFSGTWFPKSVDFSWQTFESLADFSHCVFVDDVELIIQYFQLGLIFDVQNLKEKRISVMPFFPTYKTQLKWKQVFILLNLRMKLISFLQNFTIELIFLNLNF